MAYSTSNPPSMVQQAIAGPRKWIYVTTDNATTVDVPGYITNGGELGMKVNDILESHDTATPLVSSHRVNAVSSTAPGAVTLSTGVTVGNTADGT